MRTVKVRLREADLSAEMAAMRVWLDRNGHEARGFNCNQSGDEVILSVDFMIDAAAEAFAARFDGGSIPAPARIPRARSPYRREPASALGRASAGSAVRSAATGSISPNTATVQW